MIWSTYKVFGSGSAGVVTFAPAEMTVSEYVEECRRVSSLAKDDGHNGFVGTCSVPDDATALRRFAWFDPGPDAPREVAGLVLVDWRVKQLSDIISENPSFAEVTMGRVSHVSIKCMWMDDLFAKCQE